MLLELVTCVVAMEVYGDMSASQTVKISIGGLQAELERGKTLEDGAPKTVGPCFSRTNQVISILTYGKSSFPKNSSMQYIILGLIVIAVIYYAWPLLLGVVAVAVGFYFYRNRLRRANLRDLWDILPSLRQSISGSCFIDSSKEGRFVRFCDVIISGPIGQESLKLAMETIYWDDSLDDNCIIKYRRISKVIPVCLIKCSDVLYTFESAQGIVSAFIKSQSLVEVPRNSMDFNVCSLIFLNYPEAAWADDALQQISESLKPIKVAHAASLTNELLAGNSESLLSAMRALDQEANMINDYANELYSAIRKCAEFLAIPEQLRNLSKLDTGTLEAFSKRESIRQSFDEIIAVKSEYDRLSSRGG